MKKSIKCMILTVASMLLISACTSNTGVIESSISFEVPYASPTPVPYEQPTSYYDVFPGVGDVSFNTTNIQNLGGQDMPLFESGSEVTVSFSTEVVSTDLMFEVEPMPYDPSEEITNPVDSPMTIPCVNGRYEASFTDCNNCFLGYYMRFYDGETDVTYFDAIVACGDASVLTE